MNRKKRFEVFRRDSFRCVYCGNQPPGVVLEVDHIVPKSKGGKDDHDNLVTSCFDCNRGKSNGTLKRIEQPQIPDRLAEMRDREDQLAEYYKYQEMARTRVVEDAQICFEEFQKTWTGIRADDYQTQIKSLQFFCSKLGRFRVLDAIDIAISKDIRNFKNCFKYMCGVCHKWISEGKPNAISEH